MSRIAIIGSGAWGTALAISLARRGGHSIALWSHTAAVAGSIAQHRENRRYLPGYTIPDSVEPNIALAGALEGAEIVIPVKHGDGRYVPPPDLNPAQIVLRYLDNPNGSVDAIAGVCNEAGNVMGLMPHPEHAVDPLLGSDHGAFILASLIDAARDRSFATIS